MLRWIESAGRVSQVFPGVNDYSVQIPGGRPLIVMSVGTYGFSPRVLPTLVTVILLAVLAALGFWQIERGEEKQAIEAAFAQRTGDEVLSLARITPVPEQHVYRRARAAGSYHERLTFLVDNRVHKGRVGYQVVTPLQLSNAGRWVLVDRGWVPLGESRTRLPQVPPPEGELTIGGYLALPQRPPLILGDPAALRPDEVQVVQWLDLDRIEGLLGDGVLPLVLRQQGGHDPALVKEWPVINMSPERHFAYAAQWFSLAVALLVIYLVVNLRKNDARD